MNVTSLILQTAMRLLLPLTLTFALVMALQGHNLPGGGFIAGLIASAAICSYRMANGRESVMRLIPVHPRKLLVIGLTLALLTGVAPLLLGRPFLTSTVRPIHVPVLNEEMHFASAMIFDIGVLFVVVGVTVGMITRLSEELE